MGRHLRNARPTGKPKNSATHRRKVARKKCQRRVAVAVGDLSRQVKVVRKKRRRLGSNRMPEAVDRLGNEFQGPSFDPLRSHGCPGRS